MENNAIVYHYCSTETFLKIIQSKTLHLSELAHTNDPQEVSLAKPIIINLREEHPDILNDVIDPFAEDRSYFSLSFSCNSDLLSQWRAYSSNGTGFMIGIDPEILKAINREMVHSEELTFENVFYDTDAYRNHLKQQVFSYGNTKARSNNSLYLGKLNSFAFQRYLIKQCGLLKDSFYKEEKELRVFRVIKKPEILSESLSEFHRIVKYHYSKGKIIPFIELVLLDSQSMSNCLKSVMHGPNNATSEIDVKNLLLANGFNNVLIERSKGSYR
ncbi:DUF2971 domain-containing protein [Rheinheimera riviphila]|uniref:DUF2971 domain-containing protein n=1 Tax=Rheinheimera riviphila TaxID=1834037 RepID=A0A437QRI2_9GAMM|nr:DUF2971 domain-containing protein [Rheinheimera riviphila]RVU37120.1 DUF2971 domain-containing protein [Rheinheimera riviphila]